MQEKKTNKIYYLGCASDKGQIRSHNEDYASHFHCKSGEVFLVCDGMGGHASGEKASKLAAESIESYFHNNEEDTPIKIIQKAIQFANNEIVRTAHEQTQYKGMGTTLVLAYIPTGKQEVFYAHVGDSRIYLYSDKKLHQLTKDQSLVQNLIDKGVVKKSDAENHPQKNVILQALGAKNVIKAEIANYPIEPKNRDMIMLCSDGLSNMLSKKQISAILNQNTSIQEKAQQLIDKANKAGGEDNITVQLLEFTNLNTTKTQFNGPSLTSKRRGNKENFQTIMLILLAGMLIALIIILLVHKYY